MLRTVVFASVLTLCLVACSTKTEPLVWISKDFAITDYTSFDIQTVYSATDSTVQPHIMLILTVALNEQFAKQNLQHFDSQHEENAALTAQVEVLVYKVTETPGLRSRYKTQNALCILRTRLINKKSNDILAEIFTVNQIYFGDGLLSHKWPEHVLRESAATVAKELAKITRAKHLLD